MIRLFLVSITVVLFSAFAIPAHAQEELGIVVEAESEVETTAFDLYLGDTLSGLILADYGDNWFQISVVDDALDQLGAVKDKEAIRPLLEGRIPGSREIEGVGSIKFDLSTFRIIILPNAENVEGSAINLKNIIPDPERKLTLQQRIQAAGSGDPSEDIQGALTFRSLASYGKALFRGDATLIDGEDSQVNELLLGGIVWDEYQLDSGLLRTEGQSFSSSTEIMGVSLRTSEDIFLDQDLIRGSKFEIFIPSRSRVEFFRNGRLLAVQVLDFGLQEIDTRSFPQGSYNVDVVITEDNGNIIRETRFFTKTGYLGIRSKPIFFGQAGFAREELDRIDVPLYQVGSRWRATDILQLETSVQGTDQMAVGELGLTAFYKEILFNAAVSSSTENDIGYLANISGSVSGVGFSASYSEAPGDDDVIPLPVPSDNPDEDDSTTPTVSDEERVERAVNQAAFQRRNISGSLYKTFGPVRLRYAGNLNERAAQTTQEEDTNRWAHGPSVEWKILEKGPVSLRLNAEFLKTDEGEQFSTDLNFRYKFNRDFSVSSRLNHRNDDDGDTNIGNLIADYNTKDRTLRGTRVEVRFEGRDEERTVATGGSIDGQPPETTTETNRELRTELNLEHTNLYLDSEGFLIANRFGDTETDNVGAFIESNFIVTGKGISVSNPVDQESVLLASIESETTNSEFDVVVNNVVLDKIKPGAPVAIGISPYKTYTLQIRPRESADLVNYDATIEKVVFFPGNVIRRSWKVERIFIGLGRLIDEEGEPIPLVRIKGTEGYAFTEKDGTFQVEIAGTDGLYVETKKRHCRIILPKVESAEYFVDFGDVPCVPVKD